MTATAVRDLLVEDRRRVEAVLRDVAAGLRDAPRVGGAVRYALEGGGKRIRPLLCIAACRAVRGGAPEAGYRLGAALELIHTYSLIHDDLPSMDDDPVRRGRPSTHVAMGVRTATVAGAAMIPLAAATAASAGEELGLDEPTRMRIVRELCAAAGGGGMVGGQLLDLEAERRATDREGLERIHRMKTGALLAVAPRIGGLAAGAAPRVQDALDLYGSALGLAFQIADDILDVTGTTGALGKTAGRDTELGKATFPALMGVDEARNRAEEEVAVARAALEAVALRSPELDALARYAIERDR